MKLFEYSNFELKVDPEALLLKPFSLLADKYKKDIEMLRNVFAFIYFYADTRSDYQIYRNEEERIEKIKQGLGLAEDWQPDNDILAAIEFYNSFKSEAALLLEDTKNAIAKLREAMNEINFKEVDDKGKPIYPLNQLTQTIKVIPSLVSDLKETEAAVNSEIRSAAKARGSQDKTLFDDGIEL
jgi:hypothetical protein